MTRKEYLTERERLSDKVFGLTAQLVDAQNTGSPMNEIRTISRKLKAAKKELGDHEIKYNPQLEIFHDQFS